MSYFQPQQQPSPPTSQCKKFEEGLAMSRKMHRQDSGYASIGPQTPITSRDSTRRRTSTAKSTGSASSARGSRPRATARGSAKSARQLKTSRSGQPTHISVSAPSTPYSYSEQPGHAAAQFHYFHFPPPDPHPGTEVGGSTADGEPEPYPVPPQTTHYWTSDSTRRLEYAAIDAASRGVKGWIWRHMVPDCIVPKEKRLIGFDDDTGSVRRYRIELESESSTSNSGACPGENSDQPKKKGRGLWRYLE